GIWHAWHFRFALGSVIKVLCGSFCSACLHPLTRRYTAINHLTFSWLFGKHRYVRVFRLPRRLQ
ncbi:DUF3265 domain-containing protein, partial [Vibrio vulnificus]|nr:DUF3265 domain-containing protein [Vibrio vulnificus]